MLTDSIHEFRLVLNRHVAEEAAGDFREENLDHIEPERVFRDENEQKTARVAGKVLPRFSGHLNAEAEVVQSNDDPATPRVISIRFLQQRDVVLSPVSFTFFVVHIPCSDRQGGTGTACVLLRVLLREPCGEYFLPPAAFWRGVSGGWEPDFPASGLFAFRSLGQRPRWEDSRRTMQGWAKLFRAVAAAPALDDPGLLPGEGTQIARTVRVWQNYNSGTEHLPRQIRNDLLSSGIRRHNECS